MADLRMLEHNYPKDSRTAFEDLCTLLFCTELDLPHGVNRRVNQRGIESDPERVGDKVYAYQAKYYDAATRLKDRKDDFVKAIDAARDEGVTDLLLFVNKDLPDRNADGSETKLMRDLEAAAQGGTDEPGVRLHWWSRSKIETTLDVDGYGHARRSFLGEGGESRLAAYYDYVCREFRDDNGSELYGEVPLRECYIEPTVRDERGCLRSVSEYVESWVDDGGAIAVICGEPGHGKTSLCRKAVYDFHMGGWLARKVPNVLHFSLNPAGTDALDHRSFRFHSLLSWGDDRLDEDNRLRSRDRKGALVFLDGFDELLEWRPGFDLGGFIEDYVSKFQRDAGAHVVITTRSMAVDPGKRTYDVYGAGRRLHVPILRMQPVSKESQVEWIERCADYFRRLAASDADMIGPGERERAASSVAELGGYSKSLSQLHEDETLKTVLGVPIILRMVVAARYVPEAGTSIVRIYDDLFRETWRRRMHDESGPSMEDAKAQLSRHALRVYLDEGDTAVVEDALRSPWSFSFYTTNEGRSRIGFLHRSFYQYFLAHEVVGWFRRCAQDGDADVLRANLACLARRQLDDTTLGYMRDIHDADPERDAMDVAFDKAYEALRETDGFLPITDLDGANTTHVIALAPSERARNVFWNVVSVCSACGSELTGNRLISSYPLRLYDMSGCVLIGAVLSNANLEGARLAGADLRDADLNKADLALATLAEANLAGANLAGANLTGAVLWRANLEGMDLTGVDLEKAMITGTDLD